MGKITNVCVGLGALCAAGGVALALGGSSIPYSGALLARGMNGGVLGMGGLTLLAVGWCLSRLEQRQTEQAGARQDEVLGKFEALNNDVAQIRSSMQELRIQFVHLDNTVRSIGRDLPRELAQNQENATREAVFRLAASLDQLHAKLDQRMNRLEQDLFAPVELPVPAEPEPMEEAAAFAAPSVNRSVSPAQPTSLGLLDLLDDHRG